MGDLGGKLLRRKKATPILRSNGSGNPEAKVSHDGGSSATSSLSTRSQTPRDYSPDAFSFVSTPRSSLRHKANHSSSHTSSRQNSVGSLDRNTSRTTSIISSFRKRGTKARDVERIRREGPASSTASRVSRNSGASSVSRSNPVPDTLSRQTLAASSSDGPGRGGVRLTPDDISTFGLLRRAGSRINAPEQIPRRPSRRSSSRRVIPGGTGPRRSPADDRSSLRSRRTDSSISDISYVVPQEPRKKLLRRILGNKNKAEGKSSGDAEDTPGKREEMKKKLIDGLKKVKEIAKPIGHDLLENLGSSGRMVTSISMFLFPAALMMLYAWDALQFVEDNKETCRKLLKSAILQHEELLDLVKICTESRNLTEGNVRIIEQAMKKHGDACQALYDAILAQKSRTYIVRFIKRKQIGEKELTSAKGNLQDAMQEYMRVMSALTWVNTASNADTIGESHEILRSDKEQLDKVYEMLSNVVTELDQSSAESLMRASERLLQAVNMDDLEWHRKMSSLLDARKEAEAARLREEKAFFDRLNGFLDARDPGAARRESAEDADNTLIAVVDELLGTEGSAATTIQDIKESKKADEKWLEELRRIKESGTLTEHDKQELETLSVRLKGINALLPILEAMTQPGQTLSAPEERRHTPPQVLMLPSRARISGTQLDTISEGRRESRTGNGFELIIDKDAAEERSDARDARDFQNLLVSHYPVELKRALWTPGPVLPGDIGYIKDGKFVFLFSITNPGSESRLKALQPMNLRVKDDTKRVKPIANGGAITKHTKRSFILRRTDSMDRLSRQFEQPIRKIRGYGSSGARRALLVVDEPEYKRIPSDKHEAIRNWLNQSLGVIRDFLERKKGRRFCEQEDIHVVTGVLRAKHWALLLMHKAVDERIHFCEFDKVRPGTAWGVFSLENSRLLDSEMGDNSDQLYTSKVSPLANDRRLGDAVLLSTMRFKVYGKGGNRHH